MRARCGGKDEAPAQGYKDGLAAPKPISLDRDNGWLMQLVEVDEGERAKFWKQIDAAPTKAAPKRYRDGLLNAE